MEHPADGPDQTATLKKIREMLVKLDGGSLHILEGGKEGSAEWVEVVRDAANVLERHAAGHHETPKYVRSRRY